ncbi:MAG TPA: thioesterase family protein [Micromonosporaceae bacterium]
MADAFYLPLGDDRYLATPATEGPWSPEFQHGGPPTALLVHVMERTAPRDTALLTRITAEFLAPVPVTELRAVTRVVRDGRNTQLLAGELATGDRTVMRAFAWRLRRTDLESLEAIGDASPPSVPDATVGSPVGVDFGYARAVEWRVAAGTTTGPGPATVWTRLRTAVVAGAEPSPAQRVVAVADSGSGVSAELDFAGWSFLNVDLTVHLVRPPTGEWVCLDARTQVDPGGVGLANTTLWDRSGRIGTAAQSLLVAPR